MFGFLLFVKVGDFLGIGAWHHFIFKPLQDGNWGLAPFFGNWGLAPFYFSMRVEASGKTSIAFKTTGSLFR